MSRPLIVFGDKTDHGGEVIGGSPFTTINGKPVARVGDLVTCKKDGHDHTTKIVTGDTTYLVDGKPVARDGDETACGAKLIASQLATSSL